MGAYTTQAHTTQTHLGEDLFCVFRRTFWATGAHFPPHPMQERLDMARVRAECLGCCMESCMMPTRVVWFACSLVWLHTALRTCTVGNRWQSCTTHLKERSKLALAEYPRHLQRSAEVTDLLAHPKAVIRPETMESDQFDFNRCGGRGLTRI